MKRWSGIYGNINNKRMSQALRKLTASVSKNNCLMIFINQLREKVGIMFGNPETTAGGRALKFYASIRLDVRRTETVKDGGEAVSNKVKVKVVKNKVAPPFKEAVVTIKFGKGIDMAAELLDVSVENGEIIKSGAWYSLKNGERIGQGAENAKKYIEQNEELRNQLMEKATNLSDEQLVSDCIPSESELNDQNADKLDLNIITD